MTYVILDTNILVSALYGTSGAGRPGLLLDLCLAGHYQAVYTEAILDEYRRVLLRPKFGFDARDVANVLDFFRFKALPADPLHESRARPQCSDPDDQKFFDAACCWDAILVTGNKRHYPDDMRVQTLDEFFANRTGVYR